MKFTHKGYEIKKTVRHCFFLNRSENKIEKNSCEFWTNEMVTLNDLFLQRGNYKK